MKRIQIPFLILFFGYYTYSQTILEKDEIHQNIYSLYFSVDEKNISLNKTNGSEVLSYSGFYDPERPGEFALPSFDVFIAIPPGTKPKVEFVLLNSKTYNAVPEINPTVTIHNKTIVYDKIDIVKNIVEKPLVTNKGYLWIGDDYCLHLNLSLLKVSRESLKVILYKNFMINLSFDFNILISEKANVSKVNPVITNKATAIKFRNQITKEILSKDYWINYNDEYLKIGTDKNGIYRILYDDLIDAGINLQLINPRTFKLYLKGEEIPIYVAGEDDGNFDVYDYIEFAGLRNPGDNYRDISKIDETYKEYYNRYSDTAIYWLTWNGKNGLRAIGQTSIYNHIEDTLKYYSEVVHIEKNNWFDFSMGDLVKREMPYWTENKTWHEGNLGVGTRNISFKLNDVYPGKPVNVFTKLQDYASNISTNAHLLAISLNSSIKQDSGFINKFEQKVLKGNYNSNLLKEGSNTLSVYSFQTEANPNLCIVDWYEIEYPRRIKTINDSLNFLFPFVKTKSVKTFEILNIDSTKKYSLWKAGNSYKKYFVKPVGNCIVVTDTVDSSDKFFFIDSSRTMRPRIYYRKVFSNLRDKSNSAEYILITHKKFIDNANEYARFIAENYNVKSKTIDVEDIYDEYAFGFFNPEAIRDFLISTHNNWQSPKPKHVFLIGGATYDYRGNKSKFQGAPQIINYVPSFGAPVSDTWFVIWDTTGACIPQMNIGRLPVTKNEELLWYYNKHKQYVNQVNNGWNKRYLFFSGGTGNNQNQIDQLRNTNNFIIENYVLQPPIGGNFNHFYKTVNPPTNFGPYTQQQFQNAIDSGGVFISYLGHSGTQTWDNSITDPGQLKNKIDRYPLITDFGCSTAKFAEPDVVSFSQLFVNGPAGQAIAYIGNSSLGFTSTSFNFPQLFYKKILKDSVYTIGDAHRLAKIDMMNNFGCSGVFRLFTLTNTLIGDPIVNLALPSKINLSLSLNDIKSNSSVISDIQDSVSFSIKYFNYGIAGKDSFNISVNIYHNNSLSFNKVYRKEIPRYNDSLIVFVPVKNKPGEHIMKIALDSDDKIDENTENDNNAQFIFFVSSSSLKMLHNYSVESKLANPLLFINPAVHPLSEKINLEISANSNFLKATRISYAFDTLATKAVLPIEFMNKRIWLRSSLENSADYSSIFSCVLGDKNSYSISDSIGFAVAEKENVKYEGQKISLAERNVVIKSMSAGYNDGNTALIQINDQNLIPENTLGGHHIVLLDDSSYNFVEYKRFYILNNAAEVQNYINFLDTVSNKFLVVFAVSDEGRVNSTELKDKIKLFGSNFIDSLTFRGSWTMIGKRGETPGAVPEAYSKAFEGRVQTDTTISSRFEKGSFTTSVIGPSASWTSLEVKNSIIEETGIKYKLLGLTKDKKVDTLNYLSMQGGVADLSLIDSGIYPFIKIRAELSANAKNNSPSITSLEVHYLSQPELAINYQVVSVSSDSLMQGEIQNLSFYVYNLGETSADSFKVKVEIEMPDNSREKIFEQFVDSLGSKKRKLFKVSIKTSTIAGNRDLYITIDPGNKIAELYKDNNIYTIPFYVKESNAPASLNLTFDGVDILDGDYISSSPLIKIELEDQSFIPITDTNNVQVFLNDIKIPMNSKFIDYSFSSNNPKLVVKYTPELEDGEYIIKVIGKNAAGKLIDPAGIVKRFLVDRRNQLLYVYNYPNPFASETYFTFKLTQIPDEIKIKIFSVAGRLIKEIKLNSSELNYDFNRICWNGRDEDGEPAANGVYIYKIIMKKGNETISAIQKLAIVR